MTLYLVRHASARSRSRWSDDDLDRPLDDRGRAQLPAITTFFADRSVRSVRSSRAVRCIETIQGVADTFDLAVELRDELTEGARPKDFLRMVRDEADAEGDTVLCSHGDLIPEVLNRLLREGMRVIGPRGCEKGSIWALHADEGTIVRGVYTSVA